MKATLRAAAIVLFLALPASSARLLAQPFGAWFTSTGAPGKYVEVLDAPELNPTAGRPPTWTSWN